MLVFKWLALPPDILLIGVLLFCIGLAAILFIWWSMCRMAARGDG